VVVIGASLGGLTALPVILRGLPRGFPLPDRDRAAPGDRRPTT
jgi:chemotaxis response regulator CheB